MSKLTVEAIEAQIVELEGKRKQVKRDEALHVLGDVIKGGNTDEIVLACYRFTAQFRTRKPKEIESSPV